MKNIQESHRRLKLFVPHFMDEGISTSLLSWKPVSEVLQCCDVQRRLLMDTRRSRNIAHVTCYEKWKNAVGMITVCGEEGRCEDPGTVLLHLNNGTYTVICVTITVTKSPGMNGIRVLEGVMVDCAT